MILFLLLCAAGVGGVVGAVVGMFSGIVLAATRHRLLLRPGAARRLAFATSAAPFLLLALVWPDLRPTLGLLAVVSGLAGAMLTPLCLNGCPARPRVLRDQPS